MSKTDKWKFNFLSWPSVRVIALPWAHLERKMSSWGRRGRKRAAGCVPKTCACAGHGTRTDTL